MDREAAIDDLIARQQIMQAMARYSRGIDRRDEEMVKSAYHEDSYDNHGWGFQGPGWNLAALTRKDGLGFPVEWKMTAHFLGQHYIEVDGEDAVSETYFVSYTRTEAPDGMDWDSVCHGRYVDRWDRRDGEFRIAERTVVYDMVRTYPNTTPWPGPDTEVPKAAYGGAPVNPDGTAFGTNGQDDPSYELLHLRRAVRGA